MENHRIGELEDGIPAAKPDSFRRQLEAAFGLQQLLGRSATWTEVVNTIPKFARCDATVLITGETGTGKEMCARAIHHLGNRAGHPFIPVNCGAIPSELMENEFFGHEAGAYTGASHSAPGLIHDAEGGTLFLDEIDSLPLLMQVKLLRFLQDQEYRPLGGRKAIRGDVRVIAACNADLEACVRGNRFRADLYFRVNMLSLRLPPLRERCEDIPILARHFLEKYTTSKTLARELSPASLDLLLAHNWPGNVRELENVIGRAVVLAEGPVISGSEIGLKAAPAVEEEPSFKVLKARVVAQFEDLYIRRLLTMNEGNVSKAARAARKNRRAFWQLMRKHQIESRAFIPQEGQNRA